MIDNRNKKLANNLIKNSVSLTEKDNLLIEVIGEDGLELGHEIEKQVKKMNANPYIKVINYENLKNFLINSTNEEIIEYGKKEYELMKKMQAYIGISSPTSDKVHIIAPGTDLEFSIKGIPAEKYYGTFNIPDGEVATCPIKNSVNGYITYNTKTKYNDIIFEEVRFEFLDGKIINASAKEKTNELNKILDTDEGARYIGEFAFGLNPYVNNAICDTLFDEKINGSFHLTPGMALEESDNGNRSAIHWDIVKILRKEFGGGQIYFDNKLIMKDGIFVLEELKPLNIESLK